MLRITGYYSYIDNGSVFKMFYQADEEGYKIEENLISSTTTPRPPPIIAMSPISGGAIATLAGGGLGR